MGQVVAEAIRFYSQRWLPSLALGLPIALIDQASQGRSLDVPVSYTHLTLPTNREV